MRVGRSLNWVVELGQRVGRSLNWVVELGLNIDCLELGLNIDCGVVVERALRIVIVAAVVLVDRN